MFCWYIYGPFGEVIRATGPTAKVNPFRFSTKFDDDETDLLYYGYRYYNPSTGRWLSRDPQEEDGGLNLYGFIGNDALNRADLIGLEWIIDREGLPRALAMSTSADDDWDDLAIKMGFDAKDVSRWVQPSPPPNTKPLHCFMYTVPNTV